ncbi:MAG: DUF433 domain-containing protein [Caldilineaceae bacterium]
MSEATLLPLLPIDVAQYLDIQAPDDIRIKGRRIGLEHIIYAYNEGYSPEQIANKFPGLDLKIIYTLIAYYLHYRAEVDAYIAQLDAETEAAQRQWEKERSPASLRIKTILTERQQHRAPA